MKKKDRIYWAGYLDGKIPFGCHTNRAAIFETKKIAKESGFRDIRPVKIVEVKK